MKSLEELETELDDLKMDIQYSPGTKKRWDRVKELTKIIAQHPDNQ